MALASSAGITSPIEAEIACAMAMARRSLSSSAQFLVELRRQLAWPTLTRQTLHQWETGRSRVPACALVVAADLVEMGVDQLLESAKRFLSLELTPGR